MDDDHSGLERDDYDVVVIGTGLTESIIASSCAKRGLSVLHLDRNDFYGDRHASLTVTELVGHIKASGDCKFPSPDFERGVQRLSRQYALSLFPAVLPSRGPLIDLLIREDVGKYVNFRLVDSVLIWQEDTRTFRRVPGSKDQVFKDSSLSLLEKRRLMKFLMETASDDETAMNDEEGPLIELLQKKYQLPKNLAETIAYAIAFSPNENESAKPSLRRVKKYLKSAGRYGPSSFLVAQFGGAGEITQAFCRACAVHGGTYVLGNQAQVSDLTASQGSAAATLNIPAHSRPIQARHVVSAATASSANDTDGGANYLAILPELPSSLKTLLTRHPSSDDDDSSSEDSVDDVALLVIPPSGERKSVIRCLLMGEGTGSCPAGQSVLYVQSLEASTNSRETLQPYLNLLVDGVTPLFEAFHQTPSNSVSLPDADWARVVRTETPMTLQWLEGLDGEATAAKKIVDEIAPLLPFET